MIHANNVTVVYTSSLDKLFNTSNQGASMDNCLMAFFKYRLRSAETTSKKAESFAPVTPDGLVFAAPAAVAVLPAPLASFLGFVSPAPVALASLLLVFAALCIVYSSMASC